MAEITLFRSRFRRWLQSFLSLKVNGATVLNGSNTLHFNTRLGKPFPLGASTQQEGTNFCLYSEHATAVELCIFDNETGNDELARINLFRGDGFVWHIFVSGLGEGARYGYRVHGDYAPEHGHRFNAAKVLIDPYARELDRDFKWHPNLYVVSGEGSSELNQADSAGFIPKGVVRSSMSPQTISEIQSRKPCAKWRNTIIYETHVRGFTKCHPHIPEHKRGFISALAEPASIDYIKSLGVTAIELLPVHMFIDEAFIREQGLSNYWGYNTLNFFALHRAYFSKEEQHSCAKVFLDTVEALHQEGIEVILDVVYNHTAESNEYGPHLSFRGIDNASYYRLNTQEDCEYINDTGCGNTLQCEHPRVMQLIMDSLRYWAGEMGVDGFRFDLASILGRDNNGFNMRAAFFQALSQDPLLSTCKMIAEPWDIGPGGYQLGAYPSEWSEWNDKYRDISRRFWRGDKNTMPEFARRIHGSSDIFEARARGPRASLNFITSHDGFTLADLCSYKKRHNLANKEDNRDGHHTNYSDNYGAEGVSDAPEILALRKRQQRNLLATLFLSQGVPMLLAGDEIGRSQDGNNNAYCQDNEINWLDWSGLVEKNSELLTFTKNVISLRKKYSLLHSPVYIHNPEDLEKEHVCARWVSHNGKPMSDQDWHSDEKNVLGWILHSTVAEKNTLILLLFNAHHDSVLFTLPDEGHTVTWTIELDTCCPDGLMRADGRTADSLESNSKVDMPAKSLKLLVAND